VQIRKTVIVIGLMVFLLLAVVSAGWADPKALLIKPEKPDFEVEIWTDRGKDGAEYRIGDHVRLYVRVTSDAYVNVYSIMPDGRASLIYPNSYQRDNFLRAGEIMSIPTGEYRLRVTGPVGIEYIQVVATKVPLNLPREWFGSDADSVRRLVERRLGTMGRRWTTAYTSIQIVPEWDPRNPWDRWNRKGMVHVDAWQEDVTLYVDGEYVGTLPEAVELEPGSHQLVAMKKGFKIDVLDLFIKSGEHRNWYVRLEPIDPRRI